MGVPTSSGVGWRSGGRLYLAKFKTLPQIIKSCMGTHSSILFPSSPSILRARSHWLRRDVEAGVSPPPFASSSWIIPSRNNPRFRVICPSCDGGADRPSACNRCRSSTCVKVCDEMDDNRPTDIVSSSALHVKLSRYKGRYVSSVLSLLCCVFQCAKSFEAQLAPSGGE